MSPAVAILAVLAGPLAPIAPTAQEQSPEESPRAGIRVGPWSVLGPFDNPRGADVTGETGVEKHVKRMKPGEPWAALAETFTGRGKTKLAWRTLREGEAKPPAGSGPLDTGTLDLHALLGTHGAAGDNSAAYLHRAIEADAELAVELACGSDDGLRLWLDGELLLERSVPRALNVYDERVTLRLVPGTNHLLVKVTNVGGPWSFAMLEPRHVTKEEVNRAIDRGVEHLLAHQLVDGSWGERRDEYPNGMTGLAVYTLLKCGVSPRHHAVLQALECLRAQPAARTYSLACQCLAVAALHDPAQREWLEEMVDGILSWQDTNGGWSYPEGSTDLSNTQIAALALRAAAQEGVEVPAVVWNDLASFALRHQEARRKNDWAGFTYAPGHDTGYTGSMTAAGLAVLAIAREQLRERILSNLAMQIGPAIEGGLAWLVRNWSVTRNPNKGDYHLYYLYGLERVGALLERTEIGGHDWYAEGADVLVRLQDAEGGWGWQSDTCFALLFLRRATALPQSQQTSDPRLFATPEGEGELRLRVKSGTPASLWIEAPPLDRALQVARVDFFVRLAGQEWRLACASEEKTHAARYRFERPGSWEVRAEALLSDGSHRASSALAVAHEEGLDPARAGYPGDALKNRLGATKPEVRCSSALEPVANAIDNRVWTRWLCKPEDADPWIELDPGRTVEVARLLLTHARTTAAENRRANPRPARVELWLNKEKAPRLVEVDPDPAMKTVIELSPPIQLMRLKLRIVALESGELGDAAVGFSEIEVQGPESKRPN